MAGALLLVTLVLVTTVAAQTPPPQTGDWVVRDSTTLSDATIDLNGSLFVTSRGVLVLNNVTLGVRGTAPGSEGIYVEANSELDFNGGTIGSGDTYPFEFKVSPNGILEMDFVNVTDLWQNGMIDTGDVRGGIQIGSDNVVLSNCTISGNDRVAITVVDAAPVVQDCVLARSAYHTFYKEGTLIQRDAYGILNIGGSPRVERCVIREMGDYNTTYTDYVFYWSGCNLRVFAYAIYSIGGGLVVGNTTIAETGKLDDTYSVYLIDPSSGRGVYIHQYYQLYRACVWAVEPVSLTVRGCTFARNYLGIWESSNQARGIHVQGGNGEVRDCRFVGNGGSPISAEYANLTVTGCEAVDNLFTGLVLSGKGRYSVSDLMINGTGGNRPWDTERGVSLVDLEGNATLNNMTITNVRTAFMLTRCTSIEIFDSSVLDVTGSFRVDGSQVDFLNVSCDRSRYTLRGGYSDVRFLNLLRVEVTWPDGRTVPYAQVRMTDEEGDLVFDAPVGPGGDLGPFAFPQVRIEGTSQEVNLTDFSRLSAYAIIGSTRSEVLAFQYIWHTGIRLVVLDEDPPHLEVIRPLEGHGQTSPSLSVAGFAWDMGSGIDYVEVRVDEGAWSVASGRNEWSITVELEEGVHRIQARAVDVSGGISTVSVENVTVDSTPPFIEVVEPAPGERRTNIDSIVVRGRTEPGSRLFLNGGEVPVAVGEFIANFPLVREGASRIVLTAIDRVGNTHSVDLQVELDTTPPWLEVREPLDGSLVAAPFTNLEGRTEAFAEVSVNGDPVPVSDGQFTEVVYLVEGVNPVMVTVRDDLGNERTVSILVVRDMTPPDIVISQPKGDFRTKYPAFTLVGTLGYIWSHDVKWIRLNGRPWAVPSNMGVFQMRCALREGENRVVFEAEDHAGNVFSRVFNVTLDTVPPSLTVTSPTNGTTVNSTSVYVTGQVEGAVELNFNNEPFDFLPGPFSQLVLLKASEDPIGEPNTIEVRAVDDVGNEVVIILEVFCDILGPGLILDEVPNMTTEDLIYINGSIGDLEDLAALLIGEVVVEVDPDGTFSVTWRLTETITELSVRAVDHVGNEDALDSTIVLERQDDGPSDGGEEGISSTVVLGLAVLLFLVGAVVAFLLTRYIEHDEPDG